jgi:hypothetical protein
MPNWLDDPQNAARFQQRAQDYGLPPDFATRILQTESGGNPAAVSPAGAQGLMQLMPATARAYGVQDATNPDQNFEGGLHALSDWYRRSGGNEAAAAAGYNGGTAAFKAAQAGHYDQMPKETQNYVQRTAYELPQAQQAPQRASQQEQGAGAYFQMPSGKYYQYSPQQMGPAEAEYVAMLQYPKEFQPPQPPPELSTFGALKKGVVGLAESTMTGVESIWSPEKAAQDTLDNAKELDEKYGVDASWGEIGNIYRQKGLMAATAFGVQKGILHPIAENTPMLAAAMAGAAAGSAIPGLGTAIGGAIGAGLVLAPSMLSGNIAAQAAKQQQENPDQPLNIAMGPALAATVAQSVVNVGALRFMGAKFLAPFLKLGEQEGAQVAEAALLKEANAAVNKTTLAAMGQGAAIMPADMVMQTVLNRWQAGQELLSPDAMSEYGQTAAGALAVGAVFGGLMHFGTQEHAQAYLDAYDERQKQQAWEHQQQQQQQELAKLGPVTPEEEMQQRAAIAARQATDVPGRDIAQARQELQQAQMYPRGPQSPWSPEISAQMAPERARKPWLSTPELDNAQTPAVTTDMARNALTYPGYMDTLSAKQQQAVQAVHRMWDAQAVEAQQKAVAAEYAERTALLRQQQIGPEATPEPGTEALLGRDEALDQAHQQLHAQRVESLQPAEGLTDFQRRGIINVAKERQEDLYSQISGLADKMAELRQLSTAENATPEDGENYMNARLQADQLKQDYLHMMEREAVERRAHMGLDPLSPDDANFYRERASKLLDGVIEAGGPPPSAPRVRTAIESEDLPRQLNTIRQDAIAPTDEERAKWEQVQAHEDEAAKPQMPAPAQGTLFEEPQGPVQRDARLQAQREMESLLQAPEPQKQVPVKVKGLQELKGAVQQAKAQQPKVPFTARSVMRDTADFLAQERGSPELISAAHALATDVREGRGYTPEAVGALRSQLATERRAQGTAGYQPELRGFGKKSLEFPTARAFQGWLQSGVARKLRENFKNAQNETRAVTEQIRTLAQDTLVGAQGQMMPKGEVTTAFTKLPEQKDRLADTKRAINALGKRIDALGATSKTALNHLDTLYRNALKKSREYALSFGIEGQTKEQRDAEARTISELPPGEIAYSEQKIAKLHDLTQTQAENLTRMLVDHHMLLTQLDTVSADLAKTRTVTEAYRPEAERIEAMKKVLLQRMDDIQAARENVQEELPGVQITKGLKPLETAVKEGTQERMARWGKPAQPVKATEEGPFTARQRELMEKTGAPGEKVTVPQTQAEKAATAKMLVQGDVKRRNPFAKGPAERAAEKRQFGDVKTGLKGMYGEATSPGEVTVTKGQKWIAAERRATPREPTEKTERRATPRTWTKESATRLLPVVDQKIKEAEQGLNAANAKEEAHREALRTHKTMAPLEVDSTGWEDQLARLRTWRTELTDKLQTMPEDLKSQVKAAVDAGAKRNKKRGLTRQSDATPPAPVSYDDAASFVKRAQASLGDSATIYHGADGKAAPPELANEMAEEGVNPQDVKGWISADGKRVWLNNSQHATILDVERTLAHELIGHRKAIPLIESVWKDHGGFHGFALALDHGGDGGGGLNALLKDLGIYEDAKGQPIYRDADVDTKAKEAIAAMEERRPGQGITDRIAGAWKEIVGAVRQWLRDHGWLSFDKANDYDIYNLLRQARNADHLREAPVGEYGLASRARQYEGPRMANTRVARIAFGDTKSQLQNFKDKLGSMFGLAGRIKSIDQFAGWRAATAPLAKEGTTAQARDLPIQLYHDQTMAARNGMLAGVALTHGVLSVQRKNVNGVMQRHYEAKGVTARAWEDTLKAANRDPQAFNLYMIGKRADRLGWDTLPEGLRDSQTEGDWKKLMADGDADQAFQKARGQLGEYNKNLLKLLLDTGYISPQMLGHKPGLEWQLHPEDYVPFYRKDPNGDYTIHYGALQGPIRIGNMNDLPDLKQLLGGKQHLTDLMTGTLMNTTMMYRLGLGNQAMRTAVEALEAMGIGQEVKEGVKGTDILHYRTWDPDTGAQLNKSYKIGNPGAAYDVGDIPGEILVKSLEGLPTTLPWAVRALQTPANWMRHMTLGSPFYMMRQLFKEPAAAFLGAGADPSIMLKVWPSFAKTVAHLWGLSKETNPLSERATRFGLASAQTLMGDKATIARKLMERDPNIFKRAWAYMEEAGVAADAAVRSIYLDQMLQKGFSERDAILATAKNTVDFFQRGMSPGLAALRQMVPFFGSQLASLDTMYKAYRGQLPFSEQLQLRQKIIQRGLLLAAGTIAYTLLSKDEEHYKNAPDDEKYGNWLMPLSSVRKEDGTPVILRLPIPYEYGYLFKILPEMMFNYAGGDANNAEMVNTLKQTIMSSLPGIVPQGIKPFLEAGTNYNFFTGRPIVSEEQQKLPQGQRYTTSTSHAARALGFELANIQGTHYGVSPLWIDHFVSSFAGPLGVFAAYMAGPVLGEARGMTFEERPTRNLWEEPLAGSSFQPQFSSRYLDRFEGELAKATSYKAAYDKMIAERRFDDAQRFMQNPEMTQEYGLAHVGAGMQAQLASIRKMRNSIYFDPGIAPDEKQRQINQLKETEIQMSKSFGPAFPALR